MWHLWKKPFDIKYLRPVHAVQDPGIQQEPLYFSNEQGSSVSGYTLDTAHGTLSGFQTISTLPAG